MATGDRPLVTAVIPTRDRAHFARRAIGQALAQREVAMEVVVVDDGGHVSLQSLLCDIVDPRVRFVRREVSGGVASARNAGIAQATAPWLAFLDDDDAWSPWKTARQLQELDRTGASWCVTGAASVDEHLVLRSIHSALGPTQGLCEGLCRRNTVPGGGSGVLMSTALACEIGGFDETLAMVADWEMWHRAAHRTPCAVVDEPLVGYTQHRASMKNHFSDHKGEMARLAKAVSRYCSQSPEAVRVEYLDWISHTVASSDRLNGARMKAQLGWETRSIVRLVTALRLLLLPQSLSLRNPVLRRSAATPDGPAWLADPASPHARWETGLDG